MKQLQKKKKERLAIYHIYSLLHSTNTLIRCSRHHGPGCVYSGGHGVLDPTGCNTNTLRPSMDGGIQLSRAEGWMSPRAWVPRLTRAEHLVTRVADGVRIRPK